MNLQIHEEERSGREVCEGYAGHVRGQRDSGEVCSGSDGWAGITSVINSEPLVLW